MIQQREELLVGVVLDFFVQQVVNVGQVDRVVGPIFFELHATDLFGGVISLKATFLKATFKNAQAAVESVPVCITGL